MQQIRPTGDNIPRKYTPHALLPYDLHNLIGAIQTYLLKS